VALIVLAVVRAGDTLSATDNRCCSRWLRRSCWPGFVLREPPRGDPLLTCPYSPTRGIRAANLSLLALGAFNAGQILLLTAVPAGG